MKTKTSEEYDRFAGLMGELIKVPHSEIKAKLDAEKLSKKRKRTSGRTSKREDGKGAA